MTTLRSHRSIHRRSRWAHCNTPEALRRRRAKQDAKREAMSAELPPVADDLEPLSVWQTVLVLDSRGEVSHRIVLYVPTHGRCDQHAAEVDGARCDKVLTATEIGRQVAQWIAKRPSFAQRCEARSRHTNWRTDMQTTYWNGDFARYTGKTMTLHGGLFYEIEMLEGHLKGQTKVTQRAPACYQNDDQADQDERRYAEA